ncbi:hypothetical protein V6N11_051083 [Hibiscus sabdariffa]|uniref:DUF4283 domain-containing protein n=1 Tax=Hibiscus sabdariffa TaxID=183260 RepID=A0ABR2R375_9ROSI
MESRRVWISIYGVPIHVWMRDTFERIAAHWGSIVWVEDKMLELSLLEMGQVLIESNSLDRIEECLKLMIQDRGFLVRVLEAEIFIGILVREHNPEDSDAAGGDGHDTDVDR